MKAYTTGKISEMIGITAQSVINWCDKGVIPASRIGTGPRKVAANDLLKFLKTNDVLKFMSSKDKEEIIREAGVTKLSDEEIIDQVLAKHKVRLINRDQTKKIVKACLKEINK